MKLPRFVIRWLYPKARPQREPDFYIGGKADPYLLRWYLIPRNRFFNVYFHQFRRSDDDRALHDHPWWSLSVLLRGTIYEWVEDKETGQTVVIVEEGDIRLRSAKAAHRIDLGPVPKTYPETLFITGPKIREWGFWCPQGWRHWEDFTAKDDSGQIGRGCD